MSNNSHFVLKNVRCIFPKLFVAEEFGGKMRYSVGLLIEKDSPQHKRILEAIREVVVARFGENAAAAKMRQFSQNKTTWPLRETDDGNFLITPKRMQEKGAPVVLDQRRQNIPIDANLPYAGCWINVSMDIYCYQSNGGGVTSYLNGVQLVKEDAPLAGAGSAINCRDEFDDLGDVGDDSEDLF